MDFCPEVGAGVVIVGDVTTGTGVVVVVGAADVGVVVVVVGTDAARCSDGDPLPCVVVGAVAEVVAVVLVGRSDGDVVVGDAALVVLDVSVDSVVDGGEVALCVVGSAVAVAPAAAVVSALPESSARA